MIKIYRAVKRFMPVDLVYNADRVVGNEVRYTRHFHDNVTTMQITVVLMDKKEFNKRYKIDLSNRY
jgi:hypothetical protein